MGFARTWKVAQIAVHTPNCCCILSREALLVRHFQTPNAGVCVQVCLNGQLLRQREEGAGLCHHLFFTAVRTEPRRCGWHITGLELQDRYVQFHHRPGAERWWPSCSLGSETACTSRALGHKFTQQDLS